MQPTTHREASAHKIHDPSLNLPGPKMPRPNGVITDKGNLKQSYTYDKEGCSLAK